MKQRYNELTHDLCVRAVLEGFEDKWLRGDVMQLVNKYGGVSYGEIKRGIESGNCWPMLLAAEGIAMELEQRILDLMDGDPDALDLEEVTVNLRRDGMTGKLREIADLSPMHQLFGHLVKLGLDPLFKAKLEWGQCASITGRGQTGLKRRVERWLRRKGLCIRCAKKTDVKSAYKSTMYAVVIDYIRKDIPSARWILITLIALSAAAPGGHLIIGGYLDAWLFNYLMSYAVRYVLSLHKLKRGQKVPLVIRVATHMDDFGLLGSRMADVVSATRKLARWMEKNLGLTLKPGEETRFMTIQQEHQRRRAKRPAARGCSSLDMGGYRMHRTYTTVRGSIYLRARRTYLRAGREVENTGRISVKRAHRISSYFGYYKNSASRKAANKLNVYKLTPMAGAAVSWDAKRRNMLALRKRGMYAGA